jgi:uncharacterized protein with ATP-grasp and redox domains
MSDFLFGKEMKVHPECFPCFLRQCVIAINLSGRNGADANEVLKAALSDIQGADLEKSPAHATTDMHRTLRRMLGGDPFKEVKQRYNKIALGLYDSLKKRIAKSEDPLETAARLAIAGNVIDFGIYSAIDIEGTVERALGEPLSVDHTDVFKEAVERADDVLYLLDNAGEVVFDRLLIEDLIARGKKVTAVVKAAPIINDCTMEDAREVGLTEVCEVVDNGSDAVGTILETTSEEFRNLYEGAGLVISKGQGNFETLLDQRGTSTPLGDPPKKEIYFLFQSKCGVVSRVLGLSEGSMLLVGN